MKLPLPPRLLFSLGLALSASSLWALPVTIEWPIGPGASYRVPSLEEKPLTESHTFEVPEKQSIRVVGPGFDFSFLVDKGAVTFPHPLLKNKMGVRFNSKTNTFSFVTVEVTWDIKDCDDPVEWEGVASPNKAAEGTRLYKIIYGHHKLRYPGGNEPFFVDEHGTITLEQRITGLTAQGATLTIRGTPLTITAKEPGWQIPKVSSSLAPTEATGTVHLLPNDTGYTFQTGATRSSASFFLSDDGLLATDKNGPFQEFVTLLDKKGAEIAQVSIPDGPAKYQDRLAREKSEKETYDRVLAGSEKARWKQDFPLQDLMQFYNFSEEQISYPLELPADVTAKNLKLLAFADGTARSIPFQLQDGRLYFRADLPRSGQRLYRLAADYHEDVPGVSYPAPSVEQGSAPHQAILQNGKLRLTVPAGHQDFPEALPLAKAPAPILSAARESSPALTGSFTAPDALKVSSVDARIVKSGPLFLIYEISYTLQDGKKYTATLELRAAESEVAIGESLTGFLPEDAACLRLDYTKGLNPNRRLAAANGGYDTYSGEYAKGANPGGRLNYVLSLYTPNSIGLARATAFYNDAGDDALLLAINRPRDWVTSKRAVWGSTALPDNLVFYARGSEKFLQAALVGFKRFWVLGLIPRADVTMLTQDGVEAPASGPDVRLLNRLSDWSLDKYKDRLPDWEEKLDAAPFDAPNFSAEGGFAPLSFDDYVKNYFVTKTFFRWVRNDSWDFSSENSPVSFRDMPALFGQYAVSRSTWTPEQRKQVRQVLLFMADSSEDDANLPHHSMLAGHPNFVMDVKAVLPIAAATFPNHLRAKVWRDSFMDYYAEWMDRYSRKDVPALNTTGGRWVENIAGYVGQSLVGALESEKALQAYDKTTLARNPQLLALLRWLRDSFMSPNDGVRLIPPQGAHARAFEPGQKFYKTLFQFCETIAPEAPELAQEMRWIETNGKEGKRPDVKSRLFTDYGPVMHYDFGGPHESYAHMQLLFGPNYRWGNAGIVYYGAHNKAWSYNNEDTNGDDFSWNDVSAFTVNGKGLTPRPVDQLLYDFGFAQFYRQPGESADAYKARAMLMVRDDYLVLSDEVESPATPGKFTWASVFGQPEIYQLKPGATAEEHESHDKLPRRKEAPENRQGHVRSYSGNGDFLTVIAPEALKAEAKPFGTIVKDEYVFASAAPLDFKEGPAVFAGTYGYARPNQLALFQGTAIGLNGFLLKREGGDFGLSAELEKTKIHGRLVGRSGGKVLLSPPGGLDLTKASVSIEGKSVAHTVEGGAIVFPVEIGQADGLKNYEITW